VFQVADTITSGDRGARLRVLGPTFSGSVSSLRSELEDYACDHDMRMRHHGFEVVTGSATDVKSAPLAERARALQQLRLLSSQYPAIRARFDGERRAELDAAMRRASDIQDELGRELAPTAGCGPGGTNGRSQALLHEVAETLARVLASRWDGAVSNDKLTATTAKLRKLHADHPRELPTAELYQRADDDELQVWLRLAEELVAAQSTVFFHEVLDRLRRLLTSATVTMVLLLVGLSSYPFERQPMLLFVIQSSVVAMVVGTIWVMAGMENSEVLARIRKLDAGKVTWNRAFIIRIALFGLLPMLSVVATQLPAVGSAVFSWLPALFGLMQ
jgi:hypothetical protein